MAPELQLRCYLLKIFADMNRTINFDELMFSEEDGTLMENFVAPHLLPETLDDGISSLYYRTTEATEHDIAIQVERLTNKQRSHFDSIVDSVLNGNRNQSNLFFIDAPAGSGKSFLIGLIIKSLRKNNNKVVLPVASTGIASLLMETGTTAHKMFAIQITNEVNGQPSPNVACSPNLTQRNIIKDADIIIWDEITMTPKSVVLGVDKLLREEKKKNVPFGGCVVVFSGDFRQCLPVVLNSPSMSVVHERSFLCLPYIQEVKFLKLTENMRIMFAVRPEDRAEKQRQADALLKIGTGLDLINGKGYVDLSLLGADLTQFFSMSASSQFLTQVYDQNIFQNVNHLNDPVKLDELMKMYASTCVLTPKNVTVDEVNRKMLGRLPTSVEILKSEQVIEGVTTEFIREWAPKVKIFKEAGMPDMNFV